MTGGHDAVFEGEMLQLVRLQQGVSTGNKRRHGDYSITSLPLVGKVKVGSHQR